MARTANLVHSGARRVPTRRLRRARTGATDTRPNPLVIGVGAAAGGLEAFIALVAALPADANLALVVLQPVPPAHRCALADLLAPVTAWPVTEAHEGELPEAGHIYVAPARHHLLAQDRRFRLVRVNARRTRAPSLNRFLTTLAQDYHERAGAILWSGAGSDGAEGLAAIQAYGGFTAVQDVNSAKWLAMPDAALGNGAVNQVADPGRLAALLARAAKIARVPAPPALVAETRKPSLRAVLQRLRAHSAIDFSTYHESSLRRRVGRRLASCQCKGYAEYLAHLDADPSELDRLRQELLTPVTSFFSDTTAFAALGHGIKQLATARPPNHQFRIWVAGCGRGEEAYSVAIQIIEALGRPRTAPGIRIFATDIDEKALVKARRGIYSRDQLQEMPRALVDAYFESTPGGGRMVKPVRDCIVFARHDLSSDPPFVNLDCVTCRNVLDHVSAGVRERVLETFADALAPAGLLLLGPSQIILPGEDRYACLAADARLYHLRSGAQPLDPRLVATDASGIASGAAPNSGANEDLITFAARALLPACVILGRRGDIEYVHGDVSPFLHLPDGRVTLRLSDLIERPLRAEFQRLARRARAGAESSQGRLIALDDHGYARLQVHPLPDQRLLVGFHLEGGQPGDAAGSGERQNRVEAESTSARAQLQAVIDELAAGNEALQAANEDLQVTNEKLRSLNEGLLAVNNELQTRADEPAEAHLELETLRRERALLRASIDASPANVAVLDQAGRILEVNRAWEEFARDNGETRIRDWRGLNYLAAGVQSDADDEYARAAAALIREVLAGKRAEGSMDYPCNSRTRRRWFWLNVTSLHLPDGGAVVSHVDVTERYETNERLRLISTLFDHTAEGFVILDDGGAVLVVNRAFSEITGLRQAQIVGQHWRRLGLSMLDPATESASAALRRLRRHGEWRGEVQLTTARGQRRILWVNASSVRGLSGRVVNTVLALADISRLKDAERNLTELAYHDPLTGLPNRTLFQERIVHLCDLAMRRHRPLAVLYLDLDRFKVVNDSLGHGVGDQLLIEAAHRLSECVRRTDMVVRLGGDEFVIVIEELRSKDDAAITAEKVRAALSHPFVIGSQEIYVTVSIGITLYPDDAADVNGLVKNADVAMYRAKEAGRNAYQFFTEELQERSERRAWIHRELRHALARDELRLVYEPQVVAETGRIRGVEALLRWSHPRRGLIMPDEFVEVAEETGLIQELGQWALDHACADFAAARARAAAVGILTVNVAPQQLRQPGFIDLVTQALLRNELTPDLLELELTERSLMGEGAEAQIFAALRTLGVRIAIDDFGTGYSALTYLRKFPVTTLKIDRSFIQDVCTDENDAAIVRAILSMGKVLGLDVIAEGVETTLHLERLRQWRCPIVQGHYRGLPLSATELMSLANMGFENDRAARHADP